MKKRNIFYLLIIFICFFAMFLTGCENSSNPPEPEMSEEEKAARAILDSIAVEDFHVTYDGKEHHIREAKIQVPKGCNISYGSYDKYTVAGTYPYQITFGYENTYYREVTVNLVIDKFKPVYTGPTEIRVFLDERDDFDVEFDMPGVELVEPIHLTEVGDYKYTIQTKENDITSPIDPVEVQLYVRAKHYVYGFENKTVIGDGVTNQTIELTELNDPFDSSLFEVSYSGNEGNIEQGKYHITCTVTEKANNVVYDVYRAILTIDNPKNEEFDAYITEAFEYFFGDDQLTINILIGDYTQFGLEHQDAEWYSFDPYTDEEYASDVNEVNQMRTDLDAFKNAKLSYSQLIDYAIIDEQILEYERLFANKAYLEMGLSYVDQYGGYAAELPTQIEGFHINNKEDLDDLMHLLASIKPALLTYYDYIEYREANGYPLNEYTLTHFIEYLDGVCKVFEDTTKSYYLIGILSRNILAKRNVLGLTDEQLAEYNEQLTKLFNEDYYEAHKQLRDKTQAYLDAAKAEGGYLTDPNFDIRYLGQYEGGTDYYTILLQNKLGRYNITPKEYIAQINKWFSTYMNKWSDASKSLTSKAENIADGKVKIIDNTDFDSMLAFLKEFARTIAPNLATDPKIDVAWMDPTVTENTTTAAYYMKSPLTSTENEYIHLNEKSLSSDYLDTLSTLAHEGYPGHLYAYVSEKENPNVSPFATISTNTTHGEGWATYVQIALNDYIAEIKNDPDWSIAMEYSNYYDLMSYLLYTKCDYEVNYNKVTIDGLKNAIRHAGLSFRDDSTYESLFHTFNENPAQYPAYGYGKAYFYQLHLDAEKLLGDNYDLVDFNKMLLEHGWCSMDRLEQYYNQYMADALFLAGLGE